MKPDAPPTARAAEPPLREHAYDGIQEFDNRLPNWWLWTLYAAIGFSFAYWFAFRWTYNYPTSEQLLGKRMAAVAAAASQSGKELTDDQLWAMSSDGGMLAQGKEAFQQSCASCHGMDAAGGIGANLRDGAWIHGGKPNQIAATIANGVLEKGMPSWEPVLGRAKIAEITAYLLSLHHQKPDGSAAP